jgi:3-oxoacyl-[acyl-carrier protein] reductase
VELGLQGRTAVVAASTGGLGEAVARALAAEGASVVVTGRRGERAASIAAELPRAVGVEVDLGTEDGPARLVEAAERAFGPVDIAVLNGPGPRPGTAAGLSADDLDAALSSLVRTQHRLVALVLPGMRERAWGRVLAIGSSGVVSPLPGLAASNVGRAALAGYLKTLSAEVAADGVTVNLLLPGRVATDRVASLDAAAAERTGRTVDQVEAESRSRIPAGRYGRPEEFGAVAAFLCSDLAGYVTGVALRCDGGLVTTL